MRQYIIECRNCMKHSRIEWDETERQNVEFYCPFCGRVETEALRIIEDDPTVDIFYREIPLNVQSWERFDPLGLSEEGGMNLGQKRKSRMKRIESLDFRKPEEDSLLRKARRTLTKILGR